MNQKQALAFIEEFEIVGDNNLSRDPTPEEKFVLSEFVLQLFDATAAAPTVDAGARDEQEAFLQWVNKRPYSPSQIVVEWIWDAWQARAALSASTEAAAGDDARNLVTLDRRDLWDHVRGAIHAALNDKIPKDCVVSWAWEEATNRTMDIFNKIVDTAPPAASGQKLTNEQRSFFVYDPSGSSFEFYDTDAERDAAHREAIKEFRNEARGDGQWSLDVESIVSGVVTHKTVETDVVGDQCDYAPGLLRASSATASDKEGA